jgi:peptidoglycan/xylan/chitin deacetylase (PgdA/CDA1 family)
MKLRYLTYHKTTASLLASDIHVIPQSQFEGQIDFLCSSGLEIVDARYLDQQCFSRPYAIGLTFDDGCQSDYDNARYLKSRGINGIFFISTARIGTSGFLTCAQILEMRDMGMLIGSHSHEHRALNLMPIDEALEQMATSKRVLEELLGHTVDHLAFPGGGHNREVVAAAHAVGFRYVFTTIWGANEINGAPPTVMRRDTVVRGMSPEQFRDLVVGRQDLMRRSLYWCKQAAHSLLPKAAYRALRRRFIDG